MGGKASGGWGVEMALVPLFARLLVFSTQRLNGCERAALWWARCGARGVWGESWRRTRWHIGSVGGRGEEFGGLV